MKADAMRPNNRQGRDKEARLSVLLLGHSYLAPHHLESRSSVYRRPPCKSLPTFGAAPLLHFCAITTIIAFPSAHLHIDMLLQNTRRILRYPLNVALYEIRLGTVLLLVPEQTRATFGTVYRYGLV